jgi:glycerate kinase
LLGSPFRLILRHRMKTVLAFDSWKECLTASQVCAAAEEGVRRAAPVAEVVSCPLSDGGEGFAETLARAAGGRVERVTVTGPLFEPVEAHLAFLADGRIAVVESAQACGLHLVPAAQRHPGRTTTRGVGELIRRAAEMGASEVVVGLGGSATNDGGMGLLEALGWQFKDEAGRTLFPCGDSLERVQTIVPGELPSVRLAAACDVRNPLHGPRGAACVFAPQKGAGPDDVRRLDEGLAHFAGVAARLVGQDISAAPGAGAAGGMGFALLAFLKAQFRSGADLAIELSGLRRHLVGAALCFTGEGRTDGQTAHGKLPAAVAACCQEAGVPCVCLSGALGEGWRDAYAAGFAGIFAAVSRPVDLAAALREAPAAIADRAEAITRFASKLR